MLNAASAAARSFEARLSSGITSSLKRTRTCAFSSAVPVGEIESIHGGSVGLGSGETAAGGAF